MNPLKELEELEEPVLTRAGEAIQILAVKVTWAAHEVVSYEDTQDAQDLVEAERILTEARKEIDHALDAIRKEIHQADERISGIEAEAARKSAEKE